MALSEWLTKRLVQREYLGCQGKKDFRDSLDCQVKTAKWEVVAQLDHQVIKAMLAHLVQQGKMAKKDLMVYQDLLEDAIIARLLEQHQAISIFTAIFCFCHNNDSYFYHS